MSLSRLFLLSFFPYFSIFANISLRTVFGILGNITAFGFYAAAAPTIYNHWIHETVEDSQPYAYLAYLAALMNCMICFVYGLPIGHPFNWPLLIINGGGFLLEATYIYIFYKFSPADLCDKIKWILAGGLAYVMLVLPLALYGFYILYGIYTPDVLGIHCVFTGILMYGSPTIIIKEVFQTKNVEHMPLATTVIGLFNASFWTAYSVLSSDLYILVPNAMGIIFGAFQFIVFLCFKFCCTTPRDLESVGTTTILSEDIRNATPRDLESLEGTTTLLGKDIRNATPRDLESPEVTTTLLGQDIRNATPRDLESPQGTTTLLGEYLTRILLDEDIPNATL